MRKNCLISQNYAINIVTSKKHCFLKFPCLFEAHDCDLRILQWVRIWIQKFTKGQNVRWNFYIASEFELKPSQRFSLWNEKFNRLKVLKKKSIKKSTSWLMLHRENDLICICRASLRSMVLNCEFYDASGFEINIFEVVRIWKSLRSQNHDIHCVIPWKHCFSQFLCLFETHV